MGIHLCICFLTGPLEVPVEAKKDLEQKVVGDGTTARCFCNSHDDQGRQSLEDAELLFVGHLSKKYVMFSMSNVSDSNELALIFSIYDLGL